MTRSYQVLVDWDGDGYVCRGVGASDPLNTLPDPVLLRAVPIYAQTYTPPSTFGELFPAPIYEETPYGLLHYRVEQTGTLVQFVFARDRGGLVNVPHIPVTPEVEHVASVYVRLNATTGANTVTVDVFDSSNSPALASATVTLSAGVWVRGAVAFTPPAGEDKVWLLIQSTDGAIDVSYDLTGFMVTVGDTPPAFNAGKPTNAYDDVTARIRDTVTLRDGLPYDDNFGAPAEMTAGLDNGDGFWNPNNAASPVYGAYRRGLMVEVDATFDTALADGDMEAADASAWEAISAGVLSKETGTPYAGARVLRVTRAGGNPFGGARQMVLRPSVTYRIRGVARSDGSAAPRVASLGATLWLGDTTTDWQPFAITHTAVDAGLVLRQFATADGQYVEFDAVTVRRVIGETEWAMTHNPLWRGTLAKITLSGEDGVDPRGMLFAEDALDLMSRTEYAPAYAENVRVDEMLARPFDDAALVYPTPGQFAAWDVSAWQTDAAYYENRVTALAEGYTTLPYAGDNVDRGDGVNLQQYLRQMLACECGGRFFWDAVIGRYVFHNRLRDAAEALTEWTPGAPVELQPLEWAWGDDVINHVDLTYETRAIGSPGTVVWAYDNLPLALAAGKERKLSARYTSADTDAQIAVKDGIPPVAGLDYDAAYTDAGLENANAVLNILVTFNANTAEVRLTNSSDRPLELSLLRLRGTPVTTRRAQSVTSRDAASIARNGLHKMTIGVPTINTEDFAQQYADVRAHERAEPIKLLRQIAFAADQSPDVETTVLQARVGDLLNADTGDGAQKYIVLARQHILDLSAVPEFHAANYTVKAIVRTVVGLWESALRGIYEECVYGL